ncbi:MAG TPA: tetratricopeptide repeat protein [Tepidisphaeraceae bacterium]|nr:tetratricopeptide repeat protein [Tepidisphaeraceae bacterium]
MAEGYRDIPEEDRKKAQKFFDYAKGAADTGNYDYSIELFLQGLAIDPENTDAHQALRDMALKRKASGGKKLGMFEAMKLKKTSSEDKENLINAEKLLAYDPGDKYLMLSVTQAAFNGGYYDTAMLFGPMTLQANISDPKSPDFKIFMTLKDIYKNLGDWPKAVEACNWAAKMKPDDMDLQKELKDLGAQQTMSQGKYGTGKSFRDSMRDKDKQDALLEKDKDIRTVDAMARQLRDAEAEWRAEPNEPGKLMKFVETLRKTEDPDYENRAIELLEQAFASTRQFRWRKSAGEIKLIQLQRMERGLVTAVRANPADADLKQQYKQFAQERAEEELKEYTLWAENYPTETSFRYQMADRLFRLGRFDEAIPLFQAVRQDPKFRLDAGVALGRAFLEAGFADEAVDTLHGVLEQYQVRGDNKATDMTYWYGRALEAKGDVPTAIKAYSQVAQLNFNYRDVQARIKALRAAGGGAK